MFGLEDLLLDPVSSPEEKLVRGALKDYFTLQTEHEAGEGAFHAIFGGEDLGRENQRLDIELKKRQLGAMGPQDSEAFNDTPARRVLSALGITWGNDLKPTGVGPRASSWTPPDLFGGPPSGPSARAGIGAAKDSGFFKIGTAVGSEATELGNVGSSISRAIGRGSPSRIARSLF